MFYLVILLHVWSEQTILKVIVKRHPGVGLGHIQFDCLHWRALTSVSQERMGFT